MPVIYRRLDCSGHTGDNATDTTFNRSHLKIRVFVRDQGEAENQSRRAGLPSVSILQRWVPAGILQYAGDLKRGFNADIGRKNFFEIASILLQRITAIRGCGGMES